MDIEIGNFDIQVWLKAAKLFTILQKQGKSICDLNKDADILIAAFCLVNNHILVTDNTKHFERIDNLKLVNWKNN